MNKIEGVEGGPKRRQLRILAISGSLRAASFSTAILKAMGREAFPDVTMSVKTLEGIPLYNEDLDTEPALTPIARMRTEVFESDGVVIATPEYNHGLPGVLKNALDWASRPAFASCFCGKPVLIVTSAAGGTGGVRAQYQLRETLVSMLAYVVPGREILVAGVEQRLRDDGTIDTDTMRVLTRGIDALCREILSRSVQKESA